MDVVFNMAGKEESLLKAASARSKKLPARSRHPASAQPEWPEQTATQHQTGVSSHQDRKQPMSKTRNEAPWKRPQISPNPHMKLEQDKG
jgi:DNA-nicking Smr family endonuclease